ncbi:hypothetical protein [Thalassomonas sp. RHCl1]|uniref:hypothetical protein n=1 Tax=Thalassomonas sp. RHCl1 TaxID=2995320 RepID=UPI00248AF9AD|nr:hypothetical protein [Thalassomonas sp. RHCl1]
MTDKEFYWDWHKHEDTLFTARGNFFLITESVFLIGMIRLVAADISFLSFILFLLLDSVGITISIIWICSSYKQIFITERLIKNKLKLLEPKWSKISALGAKQVKVHNLIGIVLPIVFSGIFIALLGIEVYLFFSD